MDPAWEGLRETIEWRALKPVSRRELATRYTFELQTAGSGGSVLVEGCFAGASPGSVAASGGVGTISAVDLRRHHRPFLGRRHGRARQRLEGQSGDLAGEAAQRVADEEPA